MGANGNVNDLELAKFMELAGEFGIRVHLLHGDNWCPAVANLAALPGSGNTLGDIRQLLDTGVPYRWNGTAWSVWISGSSVAWGAITGTLSNQTDLQNALNAKMGAGAYVLVSRDSALINQVNLGALTTGILKQTVAAGVSTFTIITDNSTNWNTAYTHSQIVTGNPHGTTKTDIGLGNVDNTSDVNKPVSTAQAAANTTTLNSAKAYADSLVVGLLDDRGNFNASANTWPSTGGSGTSGAILKGDLWTISVAGTLGGVAVTAGDVIRAIVDTPGTTAANWAISENNFGYTAENSANKDQSNGYAGLTLFKLNMRNVANSITSFLTNVNTAARTYTFPDKDGTVAMTSDITGTNSGTNTGDETLATLGTKQFAAAGKTTPVDADSFNIFDSAASNVLKLLTFTNLKAFLKTYFDTLYQAVSGKDASGGYTGLTLLKINFKNVAGTFTSFFTNSNTAARTYTFQDRDGTIADNTDLALKAPLASPVFTGKATISGSDGVAATYTPAAGAQTVALDCASNNMHQVIGNASGTAITFTVANVTNSQVFIVSILNGTTPSTIAGWFATIRWDRGIVPTFTSTAGKRDTYGFIRTGANTYDGFIIGQNC